MADTIVVIEPDPAMRKRVENALPKAELVFAGAGGAALAAAVRRRPDVILMDLRLPDDAGFEIFQQLQLHPEIRHVPVLFLTDSTEGLEAFGPDADRIIAADDFDILEQRVAAASSEAQMERSLREALAALAVTSSDDSTDLTQYEIDVLHSGGFVADSEMNLTPLAERAAKYEALLASSLTVAAAAKKLGVTAGRVRQRLLAEPPEMYGIRKDKQWRLPAFQFSRKGLVPNIEKVIARLDRDLDPVAVVGWFESPNIDLEQDDRRVSPLEWLAQGKKWEPVAELAADL